MREWMSMYALDVEIERMTELAVMMPSGVCR